MRVSWINPARLAALDRSLNAFTVCMMGGTAIAAITPMHAKTSVNSSNVKPRFTVVDFKGGTSSQLDSRARDKTAYNSCISVALEGHNRIY